ncbi:Protein YigP (COG3165) clustered with ubiquinone biosynthetic genes [hydrothermal vent metagenome]|uniref:Protein YigP (COG3165) clustered with ubiquinone biosynthetic genes n=1 Tax=hydrothermal vent metagenome TaxID=652676 RepID=A0A3B0ZCR5_9ZZZZ
MSLAEIAASALQRAFNQCLEFDSLSRQRFSALQGRVIAIELTGVGVQLYLSPTQDEVQISAVHDGAADVTLSGTPFSFARMGLADDSSDSLFSGDITLSGDSTLGQRFGEIIKEMDIDWEEIASQWVGDVVAHKAGDVLRGGLAWSRDNFNSGQQTTTEYLQEELRLLPVQEEVDLFFTNVHTLRDDVERTAARIKRLQQNIENVT